jgi:uncharacterized protein YndB with AHSA1/START domain
MSETASDRIEKQILLRAPRTRVWRALTDAGEFGAWFGVTLRGKFAAGQRVSGRIITPGYEHLTMEVTIERMEAERLFSFRWHPYAVDPTVDYATEPTTLVEFRLEAVPGGTLLTLVESGFDHIPAGRRAEAFRMNAGGWASQLENIQRHVAS